MNYRKKIILVVPYLYGIDKCIEANLIKLGFDVINLSYNERVFSYPNIFSRLKAQFYKRVKRDLPFYRNFKKYLTFKSYESDIQDKLNLLDNKADYALFFRCDAFPKEMINQVKKYSKKLINYQWDGIDSFPDALEYVDFFDSFYVFDKMDLSRNSKFKLASNFYFDYLEPVSVNGRDFYYVGLCDKNRIKPIQDFVKKSSALGFDINFYLVGNKDVNSFLDNEVFKFVTEMLFEDNLNNVQKCGVLVDFLNERHNGLSFRVFEALCFKKKLITTNPNVRNYDFFNENNILVWDCATSAIDLKQFLDVPYKEINPQVKAYYSFGEWIKRVLNE